MPEFNPCCPPCIFALKTNVTCDTIVDPVYERKFELKNRPNTSCKKKRNKIPCKIWPPLQKRQGIPRYEDSPCNIYGLNNQKLRINKLKTLCKENKPNVQLSSRVLRLPSPTSICVTTIIPRYKSPELIGPKVKPHAPSVSSLPWPDYPGEPTLPDLELHKPKSGIAIKASVGTTLADLISLGYNRPYAIDLIKKYGNFDHLSLELGEDEELTPAKLQSIIEVLDGDQEATENADTEIDAETRSNISTVPDTVEKKNAKKDSQSVNDNFNSIKTPNKLARWIQKFCRDSEAQQHMTDETSFKRKTLQSHSFTNIKQSIVKEYKYGIQFGNYDQGDIHFSDRTKNKQTLANLIVAYCYSFLKHPCQWSAQNIDDILEIGNQLYMNTLNQIRNGDNEVTVKNLLTNVTIDNKKIIYRISEPIIVGVTRSEDKTVYNLTKGLVIFFKQYNCALLQTTKLQLIIWKRKHYFVFDPTPRAKDLYSDSKGAAAIISFFNIKTIVSMLLERTVLGNWSFTLSNVCITKIMDVSSKHNVDDSLTAEINKYRILSNSKAVINASISLADPCFDWSANKQALPMCIIALLYTKITPSAAWCSKTLDRIITIGNILYCEIAIAEETENIALTNIPKMFTLGPYKVQICILSNVVKELVNSNDQCQRLEEGINKFFEYSTMGIIQFDNTVTYAIWNQRGFYYIFDPYPRDFDGFRKWKGTGILSMHKSIESLKHTLAMNLNEKEEYVYMIHALKEIKISVGGDELRPDKLEGSLAKFKNKPIAQVKPVCICATIIGVQTFNPASIPSQSDISVSSSICSIDSLYIPHIEHDHLMPSCIPNRPNLSQTSLGVCDLNSSSLATIQFEGLRPHTPLSDKDDTFSTLSDDVYSMSTLFDLLAPGEDTFSGDLYIEMLDVEMKILDEFEMWCEDEDYVGLEEAQHMETDNETTIPQTMSASTIPQQNRVQIFKKCILHPPQLPLKSICPKHQSITHTLPKDKPKATISQELQKDTNFIPMPDGSEIINGSISIKNYEQKNTSLLAPFMAIMAVIVSHKYAIVSWDKSILDYIMTCANLLQDVCPFRYDESTVYEFRRISLGSTDFTAKSTYILDAMCKQKLMEEIIYIFLHTKEVVIVTPNYSCTAFYKNHLYYLFDPYNSNLVGLGQGGNVPGYCFFARFTNCHQLVSRILYNKYKRESSLGYEVTRFVLCLVEVHQIPKGDVEDVEELHSIDKVKLFQKHEKETLVKSLPKLIGYQFKDNPPRRIISGENYLIQNNVAYKVKECHFVVLSVILYLLTHPINTWTSSTVDQAMKLGQKIFKYSKNRDYYEKRIINNLFLQNQFMDVIIIQLPQPLITKPPNISTLLDYYLQKRNYLMLQFPLKCMALFKDGQYHHLFDPYKFKNENARWIRFDSRPKLIEYLMAHVCEPDNCIFYSFNITRIHKLSKKFALGKIPSNQQLHKSCKEKIRLDKPFFEKAEWLDIHPIPWNRFETENNNGEKRGCLRTMWKDWDIEFSNDLWSLWGNLHQKSSYFPLKTRGKQTLCNCIVCIVVTAIYNFSEWNPILLDSILKAGNQYYVHCVRQMSSDDKKKEFNVEHLKSDVIIPPYTANIECKAIVEGTMYLVVPLQFNLYKALVYFFDKRDQRFGIIIVNNEQRKRFIAFGKVQEKEYFMYDCESYGPPLFLDKQGCSYILRTNTFMRLLFVLALTLRNGDFYIYEVIVSNLQEETN